MGVLKNRPDLIVDLENCFGKRVFAIIFNPEFEEGIKKGDEKYFYDFIQRMIVKENIYDCIILLSGFGGNLSTSIFCASLLRKYLKRYEVFVPFVAGSSLCYFILKADKVYLGNKTKITQIDPMFEHNDQILRAGDHMSHPDPEIRNLSHLYFNSVYENLKKIIIERPNVFSKDVSKRILFKQDHLFKLVRFWMKKEFHESSITLREMNKLKINCASVKKDVCDIASSLIKLCLKELKEERLRFAIQTYKVEEGYLGGFFYP